MASQPPKYDPTKFADEFLYTANKSKFRTCDKCKEIVDLEDPIYHDLIQVHRWICGKCRARILSRRERGLDEDTMAEQYAEEKGWALRKVPPVPQFITASEPPVSKPMTALRGADLTQRKCGEALSLLRMKYDKPALSTHEEAERLFTALVEVMGR